MDIRQLVAGADPPFSMCEIEAAIKHESYEGVRTVHQCECSRMSCRGSYCKICWQEIKEILSEEGH